MRHIVSHMSDSRRLDLDWPAHLQAEWHAAQGAHAVYRLLDDLDETIRKEGNREDTAESFDRVVRALDLWQDLERVFAESLQVWENLAPTHPNGAGFFERGALGPEHEDDPTDDGRDWEHEAAALKEAQRDAEIDPFDR